MDSTFLPDPPEGWFGLGNSSSFDPPILALNYFQTAPWFRVAIDPSADQADRRNLGSRHKAQGALDPLSAGGPSSPLPTNPGNGSTSQTTLEFAFDIALSNIATSAANDTSWSGLLGNFETSLFINISVDRTDFSNFLGSMNDSFYNTSHIAAVINDLTIANLSEFGIELTLIQPLPWFNETNLIADDDLDDQVSLDILATLQQLNAVNDSTTIDLNWRIGSIYDYPTAAAAIQVVTNMPWGNLRFSKAQNGSYVYMMQVGTDARLSNVPGYPTEGLRRMAFQTMLSKAARMTLADNADCSD